MLFQISTLVAHRERPFCTERTAMAIARVGQGVNLAIERFVTVGETIADDNPEIKADMYHECKEARAAGRCLRGAESCPPLPRSSRAREKPPDRFPAVYTRGVAARAIFFFSYARHTDNGYYVGASKNGNAAGHEYHIV